MSEATERERGDRRHYLYDMLAQLARMARDCDEHHVALVLQALIAGRDVHESGNGRPVGEESATVN